MGMGVLVYGCMARLAVQCCASHLHRADKEGVFKREGFCESQARRQGVVWVRSRRALGLARTQGVVGCEKGGARLDLVAFGLKVVARSWSVKRVCDRAGRRIPVRRAETRP